MEIFGTIAATLTTVSFLPQTLKTIKDKDTSGISLGMYSIFTTGVFCWTVYGFIISDMPILIANIVTFILAFTILMLKLKYK
ncbi:MtN3 and saliva related transmembrane protein [Natranaerovirga hydrolytica]|uniref:MtN3 and saliva related transmembrane protein n=1 Tax=Natranaerovirga hydrolytica TaxID=680378 RepID=A0A4R1ML45_9FIRM|nr:SemiSWEET transporter [Natranaerovirga hydrolytica]TCK93476.1 MtN3 and saliva related transmembrane protein [Natranaerovirga hydrolytica]